MKLKPVEKYYFPKYPEKSVIIHNPSILKALPERWKNNVNISIALSSIIALTLSGCSNATTRLNATETLQDNKTPNKIYIDVTSENILPITSPTPNPTPTSTPTIKPTVTETPIIYNQDNPLIAPIFQHGNGRGAFGCSSIILIVE